MHSVARDQSPVSLRPGEPPPPGLLAAEERDGRVLLGPTPTSVAQILERPLGDPSVVARVECRSSPSPRAWPPGAPDDETPPRAHREPGAPDSPLRSAPTTIDSWPADPPHITRPSTRGGPFQQECLVRLVERRAMVGSEDVVDATMDLAARDYAASTDGWALYAALAGSHLKGRWRVRSVRQLDQAAVVH